MTAPTAAAASVCAAATATRVGGEDAGDEMLKRRQHRQRNVVGEEGDTAAPFFNRTFQ